MFKVVFARVSKFLLILSVSRENFMYFLDLWVKSCTFLFLLVLRASCPYSDGICESK